MRSDCLHVSRVLGVFGRLMRSRVLPSERFRSGSFFALFGAVFCALKKPLRSFGACLRGLLASAILVKKKKFGVRGVRAEGESVEIRGGCAGRGRWGGGLGRGRPDWAGKRAAERKDDGGTGAFTSVLGSLERPVHLSPFPSPRVSSN